MSQGVTSDMLEELPLFRFANARANDALSSHKAVDKLEKSKGMLYQRGLVLRLVKEWPGKTSLQLAQLGNQDRHLIARRLPDLAKLNLVERRDPGDGGQITWWPK